MGDTDLSERIRQGAYKTEKAKGTKLLPLNP